MQMVRFQNKHYHEIAMYLQTQMAALPFLMLCCHKNILLFSIRKYGHFFLSSIASKVILYFFIHWMSNSFSILLTFFWEFISLISFVSKPTHTHTIMPFIKSLEMVQRRGSLFTWKSVNLENLVYLILDHIGLRLSQNSNLVLNSEWNDPQTSWNTLH